MGLRALEVEVLDSSGKHLATHPRAYGQASTNSEDPSMQLALLCNKPASWPNSRVRDALPDPLREWLDRQDRQTRNEALQTLKRAKDGNKTRRKSEGRLIEGRMTTNWKQALAQLAAAYPERMEPYL